MRSSKRAPLNLGLARNVVEQQILERLDLGVERLHRFEVPVDDVVEQAPQQERDTVRGELAGVIPATDDRVDVHSLVVCEP